MSRSRRPLWVLAALALLGCDPVAPPSTETGIAWSLAEHRAATISDVVYHIELRVPEIRSEPIHGRTEIDFEWSDPLAYDVVIDFVAPDDRVTAVQANGESVRWTTENDHLLIPADALEPGTNEVVVEYRAGDEALNRNDEFLYTLFVPDRAHFSLPVFDQPDLKASVAWTITAPEAWTVVANGPEAERSVADGAVTVGFLPSRPIPTYLLAFAAGRFSEESEVVDGRELRMYHRETDEAKVARNRDEIFRLHARAISWLEEYTGIEYPFQKFAFVLIPSFQYGGMEHPGGILYRAAGLMLEETATQGQMLGRASVIAHETAHMWFGDLVTMRWFDDVWTKEVYANFMAAKIVHPSFPELDHDLRFLMAHHPSAYGVDRTPGANAIRQPLDNLREAGTLYGAIIYQKAPIVMRHLEERVGEEAFRDGLREYLETFAFGNATWPALVAILDARTEEDLTAWSRVWIEEPGRPTIRVAREADDVVLRQEDPAGQGRVWPQTLRVLVATRAGDTLVTVESGAGPTVLEGFAGADLRFVLPNGSGFEYGLFVLDPESLGGLVSAVAELPNARDRGAAWVTLWDQALEGLWSPQAFLDRAMDALTTEDDELNVSALLGYVSTAYWRLSTTAEREARAPALEALLWDAVRSDRPTTARAAFLSAYRGIVLSPAGVDRLQALWEGSETVPGLPLAENDQIALATELALREVEGWEAVLEEQAGRITNPDRRARFAFVRPALDANPEVRAAFFESLRDPANREREPWVLSGLSAIHHPLRAESALPLIRPALEMVEEIQRTGDIFFPGRWLDAVLGGHNESRAAQTVRDFLDESPTLPPRLRAKVLQSADMVWRSAEVVR